jgi:hypothetical protein
MNRFLGLLTDYRTRKWSKPIILKKHESYSLGLFLGPRKVLVLYYR